MSTIYTLIYTLAIGGLFVYLFIFTYDLLYGEKHDKQIKKIHKYFRNESVSKIEMLEHQPKLFTIYQVTTKSEKKKIKMKPGYKVVKLVAKKKSN